MRQQTSAGAQMPRGMHAQRAAASCCLPTRGSAPCLRAFTAPSGDSPAWSRPWQPCGGVPRCWASWCSSWAPPCCLRQPRRPREGRRSRGTRNEAGRRVRRAAAAAAARRATQAARSARAPVHRLPTCAAACIKRRKRLVVQRWTLLPSTTSQASGAGGRRGSGGPLAGPSPPPWLCQTPYCCAEGPRPLPSFLSSALHLVVQPQETCRHRAAPGAAP